MKKLVKLLTHSKGIIFTKEEQSIYGIDVGDVIEIEIKEILKNDG